MVSKNVATAPAGVFSRERDSIDPTLDLFDEIEKFKKKLNAVILGHYYQEPDIQDISDVIGDSLALAQQAAKTDAEVIVFCGVHFMAEVAKILNPEKQVLLPDLNAGCSLADSCPPLQFKKFIEKHPGHLVLTYINCSAEVKALSDLICTSSNAEKLIRQIPKDRPILFAPDQHLGKYLIKKTGRDLVLWPGSCVVHITFSERELIRLQVKHPDALLLAHPECEDRILRRAHHVGSTSSLLEFAKKNSASKFIIATEPGIIHQMQKACPEKCFIPLPGDDGCSCNECPYMRLNTLEKVYLCMRDRTPEITLPEDLRNAAMAPLQRMLAMSA